MRDRERDEDRGTESEVTLCKSGQKCECLHN